MTEPRCARCQKERQGMILVSNTDAELCRDCEREWLLSPESRRLRAISVSLLGEWIERERCEQLNHTTQDKGG